MTQHFLLNAEARNLSLKKVFRLSDQEAWELFRDIRWADNDGNPECPHCGNDEKHYFIKTRSIWQCADCRKQFGILTKTVFAHRQLPLQDYLAAIAIYSNGAKGVSMLQLSRDLDVQYKTAFVLAHKIRESIYKIEKENEAEEKLDGQVEVDGAYFLNKVRPANVKADRIDRRLARHQKASKSCVFTIRQRGEGKHAATKTRTFVIKTEEMGAVDALIRRAVESHAHITADSAKAYDNLTSYMASVARVNHTVNYVDPETGASTNQAESFFSRMRRGYLGQHHRMSVKYLPEYAAEFGFREDTRRMANGDIFAEVVGRVSSNRGGESSNWVGYWQGRKKAEVVLV